MLGRVHAYIGVAELVLEVLLIFILILRLAQASDSLSMLVSLVLALRKGNHFCVWHAVGVKQSLVPLLLRLSFLRGLLRNEGVCFVYRLKARLV